MKQYHSDFISHISDVDPILHKVVMSNGEILLHTRDTPFRHLVRIIAGQQLSVKAAETIYGRLEHILGKGYVPNDILNCEDNNLRSIGLSRSKTIYLKAVAEAAGDKGQNFDELFQLNDDEIIQILTSIKGIGIWSAQMFLMFHLQRPDVFAAGDLGVKKAMCNLYGYDIKHPHKLWVERAEKWSPFRTLACLHLWKSLEK